ncbi:MAG: cryptochrome/photolyase family protein [Burkholderiaceae bacterium]
MSDSGLSSRSSPDVTLVWCRRDLRLSDHAALAHALERPGLLMPVFVFDPSILAPLPRRDRRVAFIHQSLLEMQSRLAKWGGSLWVVHGEPEVELARLAKAVGATHLVAARDHEPQAIARDARVEKTLQAMGMRTTWVKDQTIFERQEVLTQAGKPFSVFTPYKNAWLKLFTPAHAAAHPTEALAGRLLKTTTPAMPSLSDLGFDEASGDDLPTAGGEAAAQALLADFLPRMTQYQAARDFPGVRGPSYLSVHLRFGTVSIRQLVREAMAHMASGPNADGARTWLSELIWRDFYMQILANFPHVVQGSFKPDYDAIQWREPSENDWFLAWCEGRTGYPLVDAGMRQLNQTGYMHNRLRMVVASFLTKDLGIHWKHGEAYFAEKLNDFDLSANNGGWQWAASTGCDAQPYFRIFNPVSQSERFDPKGAFIRRYVPEIAHLSDKQIHAPWLAAGFSAQGYPPPIVDHDAARRETLARFAAIKPPPSQSQTSAPHTPDKSR